jgi:hypothetical protein
MGEGEGVVGDLGTRKGAKGAKLAEIMSIIIAERVFGGKMSAAVAICGIYLLLGMIFTAWLVMEIKNSPMEGGDEESVREER